MLSSITPLILPRCLLLLLLLLHLAAPAPDADPASSVWDEGLALAALRQTLNSTFLDSTWISPQCFFNKTTWYGLRCIENRVVSIDLTGIGLSCRINDPLVLANLTELTLVNFKNNSITGNMFDFAHNLKITTIDLSVNQFSGPMPDSLVSLNVLETLLLHDNKLSGSIPPLNQTSLKVFNVSNNKLSGQIPATPTLQSFGESSYSGNPGLSCPPSPAPCPLLTQPSPSPSPSPSPGRPPSSGDEKSDPFAVLVILFVLVDAIGLSALFWAIFTVCKRRSRVGTAKEKSNEADHAKRNDDGEKGKGKEGTIEVVASQELRRKVVFVKGEGGFNLDDLLRAPAESLGTGSFGACYKAILDDERRLVVKRVRDVSPLTDEEFGGHIRAVATLEHPNLFPLLGYYYSMEEKFLVYDLAPNGNLFDRIYGGRGKDTRIPFKWTSRLCVAKHIARAMEFLHSNSKGADTIPHGNLKPSNVLLESDDKALVADYGLMPLVPALLAPKRLAAYRSPEYQHSRSINRKSDVWNYGCLLLELVTRKFPQNSSLQGMDGAQLVGWVHRAVREEWTCEVFDEEVAAERGALKGMFKLLQTALWCCEAAPAKRPEMGEVTREVEGITSFYEDIEEVVEEEEDTSDRHFGDDSSSSNASSSTASSRR